MFDLLSLDGCDLRSRPLIDRKKLLRTLVPQSSRCMLVARHIERMGVAFYQLICERDLEGVVAKLRNAPYGEGWLKIRNAGYSQYRGRRELFQKRNVGAKSD